MNWKIPIAYLLLALVTLPCSSSAGQDRDWSRLRKAAENTRSLCAVFTQEKHLPILSAPLISRGRLFYGAPGSVRWEYMSPVKSVMLMNGDTAQVFQFSNGSWTEDFTGGVEVRHMVLSEIREWLKGRFDRAGTFTPSLSAGPPMKVTLLPGRDLKDFLTRIELVFDSTPGVIRRVEIFEPGQGRTCIHFEDVRINTELPSGIFVRP
jgi:outer membrane lipoprotein carrier protein